MARIKLTMPASIVAVVSIPVRITDINYGDHVGNDSFISIVHEARMQWLRQLGYTELDIEGTGLILADLSVEFKSESFYGDIIEISVAVTEISKVSFELYYQLTTKRDDQRIVLAIAKTGMVCYNYGIKKVTAIPPVFKAILTKE
jgi:YbgC/YbaW family acyl-CoA thioester hydrolase